MLLNIAFFEINIIPTSKPSNSITTNKENYKPTSPLMNLDLQMLNKFLITQIYKYIKRSIHHDQLVFISGNEASLPFEN